MRRSSRIKLVLSCVVLAGVLATASLIQRGQTQHPAQVVVMPRAVFGPPDANEGERARVTEVAPAPSQVPDSPASPRSTQVPADITGFLEKWRRTLITGDIDAHVSCYAPRVKRFFRQRNVSRDLVRREKERMMSIYPEISKYELRDLQLESLNGKRAVVTFTKDWDTRGVRRFAGSERQRLTLQKFGNAWTIAGEEELKVYWVKRG